MITASSFLDYQSTLRAVGVCAIGLVYNARHGTGIFPVRQFLDRYLVLRLLLA